MLNITAYSRVWLTIFAALIVASIASVGIFGLNFGIDFTGGSVIEVTATGITTDEVRTLAKEVGVEATVQQSGDSGFILRSGTLTEEQHQAVLDTLRTKAPDLVEQRFDAVGPSVGEELRRSSVIAVVLLLVLIAIYIAFAFRQVSVPVASWKYAVVTAVAALHDVLVPLGVFAILGKFAGYQVDTAFVAALLTILGYSINDTIVVMDRTRENLFRHRHSDKSFSEIVNQSLWETMGRSVNTTVTTLLPLLAIFFFGGDTTRPFILALIIGIVSGAYSSIFVASPLLVLWEKWGSAKAKE